MAKLAEFFEMLEDSRVLKKKIIKNLWPYYRHEAMNRKE